MPAELLFVTAADTEVLVLARAYARLPAEFPALRIVHTRELEAPDAIERFVRDEIPHARVVVMRALGGRAYFAEAIDGFARACRGHRVPFVAIPHGRELDDPELAQLCTAPLSVVAAILAYSAHGGVDNAEQQLRFLADRFALEGYGSEPPAPTPAIGLYRSAEPATARDAASARGTAAIVFYRAHYLSGNLAPIDALLDALAARGLSARAVFCDSLKEVDEAGVPLAIAAHATDADVLVSTMAFSSPHALDCPVIQVILSDSARAEWESSEQGLGPRDVAMHIAMPEIDGRIISVPVSFKSDAAHDARTGATLRHGVPVADRVDRVAALAARLCRLRRTPRAEKRVAILFNNYPTRNARVGNGVGLDTPASVVTLLRALRDAGYQTGELPEHGDALMHRLLGGATHDEEFLRPELLDATPQKLPGAEYVRRHASLPVERRDEMTAQWGPAPGDYMRTGSGMAIPGLRFGHVFVGIQPSRGFGKDSPAIYHSPDLPPTHFYLGYYQWIRDVFRADAVIHVGKHGNLEWLPGKGVGLAETCYPELALDSLPNVYPYIINNPGEGTQAKRRAHAVIVDHLIPPMTRAESYGDLVRLEQLADEHATVSAMDPGKVDLVVAQMLEVIERSQIYRDLGSDRVPEAEEIEDFIQAFDGYLCEIKESQIRDGLHSLGELAQGDRLVDMLVSLVRLDQSGVLGLPHAIARDLGLDYAKLQDDPAAPSGHAEHRTAGDLIEQLELRAREVVRLGRSMGPESERTLRFLEDEVRPRLERVRDEVDHVVTALDGRFVPPGPSGAPTRGMAMILPTGRNFYSVDIRAIPTQTACQVGASAAEALLARYRDEQGAYPRSIGLVVWGTSTMRTGGDDIGQILHLLGVRPVWEGLNRRVKDFEVIPLSELGRPRIDVTVRISGFFRDAFTNVIELVDRAIQAVAALDEPGESNFVRANVRAELERGVDRLDAGRRIFGSKPGSYGAGLLNLIDERNWSTDADLEQVYVTWGGYAYGVDAPGVAAFDTFRRRLARVSVAVQNQDNREHDIFDSDDYFQFHGGMIASVRAITGRQPVSYFGDTSKPDRVRVKDLREEVSRVIRSRVVNPKWIESILRHGYRGGAELAATVDYVFGYDATARVIEPWMYEKVTEAYIQDPKVREFLHEKNPWALRAMAERLLEAVERGLWQGAPEALVAELREAFLETEDAMEEDD